MEFGLQHIDVKKSDESKSEIMFLPNSVKKGHKWQYTEKLLFSKFEII